MLTIDARGLAAQISKDRETPIKWSGLRARPGEPKLRWGRWWDVAQDECVAAWDGCCPWASGMVVRLSLPSACPMRGLEAGNHWRLYLPAKGQMGLLAGSARGKTHRPAHRTGAWGPTGVCEHGAPPSQPVFGPVLPNRWYVSRETAARERPGLVEMVEALGP